MLKRFDFDCKNEWLESLCNYIKYDFKERDYIPQFDLEEKIKKYLNRKYAISVNSGTTGLLLSMKVLCEEKKDVIIPSWGYPAAFSAAKFLGLNIIVVDIDETLTMDIDALKKAITKNTGCIVHIENNAIMGNIEEIKKIAKENEIYLLEDSCPSLGQQLNNKMAGSFGDVSVLSFSPTKAIIAGEGGMILTDDMNLFRKIERLIQVNYHLGECGNFTMNPFGGCFANAQFDNLQNTLKNREKIYQEYLNNGVDLYNQNGATMYYPTAIYVSGFSEHIYNKLKRFGIESRWKYYPTLGKPNSDKIFNQYIDLPLHHNLTDQIIKSICVIIRSK